MCGTVSYFRWKLQLGSSKETHHENVNHKLSVILANLKSMQILPHQQSFNKFLTHYISKFQIIFSKNCAYIKDHQK